MKKDLYYTTLLFLTIYFSCDNVTKSVENLKSYNSCNEKYTGLWKYESNSGWYIKSYIHINLINDNIYELYEIHYEMNPMTMKTGPIRGRTINFECKDGLLQADIPMIGKVIIQKNGENITMDGKTYYRSNTIDDYAGKEDPVIVEERKEKEIEIRKNDYDQQQKMHSINGTIENPIYFYNSPSENDIKNSKITDYEYVEVKEWNNGFGYIEISNTKKGWIKSENLKK